LTGVFRDLLSGGDWAKVASEFLAAK